MHVKTAPIMPSFPLLLIVSVLLVTVLWKLTKRRIPAPLARIPGPDKDHWLTGASSSISLSPSH